MFETKNLYFRNSVSCDAVYSSLWFAIHSGMSKNWTINLKTLSESVSVSSHMIVDVWLARIQKLSFGHAIFLVFLSTLTTICHQLRFTVLARFWLQPGQRLCLCLHCNSCRRRLCWSSAGNAIDQYVYRNRLLLPSFPVNFVDCSN